MATSSSILSNVQLPQDEETKLILEPEGMYPGEDFENGVFNGHTTSTGAVRFIRGDIGPPTGPGRIKDLPDELCRRVDGLFIFRHPFGTPEDLARFPRLKVVVRMGAGYDILNRPELAKRGIKTCNVPDYGTTEVADHALALILSLRRGIALHLDYQRNPDPKPWTTIDTPLIKRTSSQTLGVLGLGRIGTSLALKAKAVGFRVVFHDPYVRVGMEKALGFERLELDDLFKQSDVVSIHTPLTKQTRGLVSHRLLGLLPKNAVIVNTARGPIIDLEALESALKSNHLAGAGLDVLPSEPLKEPVPSLVKAYREKESWTIGRVIITPHSAFHSAESWEDIRKLSAFTMRDVLILGKETNVIHPDQE